MNRKTILLLIISIIIAAAAIFSLNNSKSGTITNDFLLYDTASVVQIFMANKQGDKVNLTKNNNIWYLDNGEIAIGQNVEILLNTLTLIEVKAPISKSGRSNYVSMLATKSTKVEIYEESPLFRILGLDIFTKKRKTKVFYVGTPTQNFKGTVMKMEDSEELYVTYIPGFNGYLTERFSANYSDWLNHSIFKLPIKSINKVSVKFGKNPEQSYTINSIGNRNYDLIHSADNNKIHNYDTTRVLEMLASFRNINFESLLDDMSQKRQDSLLALKPYITLSVTDVAQQTKNIKLYRRKNFTDKPDFKGDIYDYDVDRMYAFIDGFEHPLTVQYFVFDNITRPFDFLMGKNVYGTSSLNLLKD